MMISFDEYRKVIEPAFGESERDYFLRVTNEYRRLAKLAAWSRRLNRLFQVLTGFTDSDYARPNSLKAFHANSFGTKAC